MTDPKQEILDGYDWSIAILRLTAYALYLQSLSGKRLPKGLEAEDVAMMAIEKVLTGERNWNPENNPDLLAYLKSVMKSIYSNERSSADAKVDSFEDMEPGFDVQTDQHTEEELYCGQFDAAVVADIRNDMELSVVYKGLKDGFSPGEIADEFTLDIKVVRNAQKRLHRRVLSVIKVLAKTLAI